MQEVWYDIDGYGGYYQYSNLLRFRSLNRTVITKHGIIQNRKGNYLNPHFPKNGYPVVNLYKNGIMETVVVHIFFAKKFIPNPLNKRYVNHINGNKSDYSLLNLEWVTKSEDLKHAYATGLHKPLYGVHNPNHGRAGSKHPMFGKTGDQCWLYGLDSGEHPRAKIVLDLQYGIFYSSAKEAAVAKNISSFYLRAQLSGNCNNLSNMVYI